LLKFQVQNRITIMMEKEKTDSTDV